MHPRYLDPLALDRDIRRAAGRWRRWRRDLRAIARGTASSTLEELGNPLALSRDVTGQTAFGEISERPDGDPLRQPLLRWVYRLAEQRINAAAILADCEARYAVQHAVQQPEATQLSVGDMLRRGYAHTDLREAWLVAVASFGQAAARQHQVLWERRQEIASRMSLDAPDAIELPSGNPDAVADAAVAGSQTLWDAVQPNGLTDLLEKSLGRAATHGWPGRLTPASLAGLLRGNVLLQHVNIDLGLLPATWGGASFLRGLARLGAAVHDGLAPRDQPFVVAFDPYGLDRSTLGATLAMLPLTKPFARRTLGLSGNAVSDHLRSVAFSILLELRLAAIRVRLRRSALRGAQAFMGAAVEQSETVLNCPVRPELAGLLPRVRVDAPHRLLALCMAARRHHQFREAYDDDWYRDPRAAEQLREECSLPPAMYYAQDDVLQGLDLLIRELSAALG